MRIRLYLALCALAAALAAPLAAQDTAKPARSPWVLLPNVRLFGADMVVGYRGLRVLPSVDTVLWAHAGGGWEAHALYRDFSASPAIGALYYPASGEANQAAYNELTFDWEVGISQGIVFSPRLDRNLLEAMLLAKWRWERRYPSDSAIAPLIFQSGLPDRQQVLLSSFVVALRYDGVATVSKRQTRNGVYAEASAEWGPAGLFGSPENWVRLNANVSGLVTLLDRKHIALVVGDRVEGDVVWSPSGDPATIPVWVRTSFGDANPNDSFLGDKGFGASMRGVAAERFDGTLKALNNLELRVLFPEILPLRFLPESWPVAIFPGVVVFFDAGVADADTLDRTLTFPGDFFASTGVGAHLRALIFDLVLYGSYCMSPADATGFRVDLRFRRQF